MTDLTADRFHRTYGDDARLPWYTRVVLADGSDFDLYVPGENDWPNEAPDAPSIALATVLLPEAEAMRDEAAAYVRSIVDPAVWPLHETPDLVCISCDAKRQRVIVEVNWEAALEALWYVELHLHVDRPRRPVGMGLTAWGPHGAPWPPLHVQLELPRPRPS